MARQGLWDAEAALRAENRRLREQVEALERQVRGDSSIKDDAGEGPGSNELKSASVPSIEGLQARIQTIKSRVSNNSAASPGMITMFRMEADGRISAPYTSPAMEGLWGLTPTEVAEDAISAVERVHPDDRERVRLTVMESARNLTQWRAEYRILHPERGEIWVEGISAPERLPDGATVWYGVANDITDRKRAEQALQFSEERFRMLSETVPQFVWTCEPDGHCDYLNSGWVEYTGVPEAEQLGYGWLERLHPDDRQKAIDRWGQAVESGIDFDTEFRIRRADGAYRWFKTRARRVLDANGAVRKWVGTNTDIDEIREAGDRLRESEGLLRSMLDGMSQLAWMADPSGHIFWYNRRWYEYTGRSEAEMAGWGWQSVHDPKVLPDVLAGWKNAIATGQEVELEFPLLGADGRFRDFLTRAVPLRDPAGRVVRWLGTNTDISERKEVSRALAEALEQRRLALDAARLGVWEYRFSDDAQESGTTIWDDRGRRIFGVAPGENLDFAAAIARIVPEDREVAVAAFRHAMAGGDGGHYESEQRVLWPDGSVHWVAASAQVLFEGSGADARPRRMIGVNGEITARKQAEEELRRQSRLLDGALEPVFAMDLDGRITYWNRASEALYGFDRAEAVGHVTSELLRTIYPQGREAVDQELRTSGRWVGELTHLTKDGKSIVVESMITLAREPDGQSTVIEADRDITRRKQIERDLTENMALFRGLFDESPIGSLLVDPVTQSVVDCNEIAASSLGYTREEFRRLRVNDFEALLSEEQVRKVQAEVIQGKAARLDTRLRTKSGETRDFALKAIGVTLHGKHYVYAALEDITDRKQVEHTVNESRRQLAEMNVELERRVRIRTAELESANKELEAFAYSVSHDLRAPLRGIDGWSLALMEDYGTSLGAEGVEYLERVRSEAQRMSVLISSLLQLSRVSRNPMEVGEVNLSALVRTVADRLRTAEPHREFDFSITEGLKTAGDAGLLEIALVNLLGNAAKYSASRSLPRIEFGSCEKNGACAYYVRDNGVGFDMKYSGKLFGAFQRLHKQSEFPGTGIGLATAQRIVHRHGGRIWAEAKVDEGATFFFTLPEFDDFRKNHSSC